MSLGLSAPLYIRVLLPDLSAKKKKRKEGICRVDPVGYAHAAVVLAGGMGRRSLQIHIQPLVGKIGKARGDRAAKTFL